MSSRIVSIWGFCLPRGSWQSFAVTGKTMSWQHGRSRCFRA
jgi:hypothetical protein